LGGGENTVSRRIFGRKNMRTKIHFLILSCMVLLGFGGCTTTVSTQPTPTEPIPQLAQCHPHVRGTIMDIITHEGNISSIFVEGKREEDTTYEKAYVGITEQTRIFIKRGSHYEVTTASELQEGKNVEVLFIGSVQASDPVQAIATEIVITK
jgi:hypothetical protein